MVSRKSVILSECTRSYLVTSIEKTSQCNRKVREKRLHAQDRVEKDKGITTTKAVVMPCVLVCKLGRDNF